MEVVTPIDLVSLFSAAMNLARQGGIRQIAAELTASVDEQEMLASEAGDYFHDVLRIASTHYLAAGDLHYASSGAGMLALDADLCRMLRTIGRRGEQLADGIAKRSGAAWPDSPELWRLWQDGARRAITAIADALLVDKVRPELKRLAKLRDSYRAPALPRGVQITISAPRRTRIQSRAALQRLDIDHGAELLSPGGVVVGRFLAVERSNVELLRRGADHVHRVTFERLIRFLPQACHAQLVKGVNPFNRLAIRGGLEGLAECLGISGQRQALASLQWVLEAAQAFRGGRRDIPPLLTYWLFRQSKKRPAELRIDVGEALVPGFACSQHVESWHHRDRVLLPVLDLPSLPACDKSQAAGLFDLQWELLGSMRERLTDLEAGWNLEEIVPEAASKAGVDGDLADRAVDHWVTEANPWLLTRPGDRVTLADAQALELFRQAKIDGSTKAKIAVKSWAGKKRKR